MFSEWEVSTRPQILREKTSGLDVPGGDENEGACSQDTVRGSSKRNTTQSGAPASGEAVPSHFTAEEIFQRIIASAEDEYDTRKRELFFSGVAAGFAITVTVLAYAVGTAAVDDPSGLIGPLFYPVGFIFIIIGHYQLYTENTLPPVALVLLRLISIPGLLRIWGLVLFGNLVGVSIGAYVLANTSILSPEAAAVAEEFGAEALHLPWWDLFFKGVFAGWLVAGLVWLDHAARSVTARIIIVFFIMYLVPAMGLFHIITSMCDALYLFFQGEAALWPLAWNLLLPVLLGNTLGGVVLVAILNYGLTEEHVIPEETGERDKLSIRELFIGGPIGRSSAVFEEER
ncbi:formate/nitrite transporter family protein [Halorarum salinum]|uniref:Formate/nitrite transporter family protein n=1 Tax=Halorarum salinum TaxID=2743089 RepID=A0A7D5LCH9_9EURY|nr:formate/nitrite transporter family protein [Halobaculum salinum]QLG63187.1 formate/nitrite transporter family protein [Halobaculum salinum]